MLKPSLSSMSISYYRIEKLTQQEIRYATADITQAKEITLDFTLDSLSNTAMEVIHETTSVIRAITVILLMIPAQPLRRKHKSAITITVIRYLSHPPLLNKTGISKAAHMIPKRIHFKIKTSKSSMKTPFCLYILKIIP